MKKSICNTYFIILSFAVLLIHILLFCNNIEVYIIYTFDMQLIALNL